MMIKMADKQHTWEKKNCIRQIVLWATLLLCTAIMISLCFDEGIDLDEAYSYRTVHGNTLGGIVHKIIEAHDTDIPLWYCALRVWTWIFGESWFSYKLSVVLGNVATMLLGATVIRKNWGYWTAILFMIPASLSPALLRVGVNVRMYAWTVFLVTACALIAYELIKAPGKPKLWFLLFLTTLSALFCHYFTAFCHLFIYLYLLLELWKYDRKHVWKVFTSGIASIVPFFIWLLVSDFFHLTKSAGDTRPMQFRFDVEEFLYFMFYTNKITYGLLFGAILCLMAVIALIYHWKKFGKGEGGFVLLCLGMFFATYTMASLMASISVHFFTPRHIMHAVSLMWLGIAIVLPRINISVTVSYLLYLAALSWGSYEMSYAVEYTTTPYLEETKEFIAENIHPGDIIIYNSEPGFDLLYGCYMPEQEYIYFPELTDIQALAGKRVWFLLCKEEFFTEEEQEMYGITYRKEGHYGFQIIGDCTDFDLLRVEVEGCSGMKY